MARAMRRILFLMATVLPCILFAAGGLAMEPVSDAELAQLEGTAGISIAPVDVSIFWHADRLLYTDTDTGRSLELRHLSLSDGEGGPFRFSSGGQPITFDVFTVDDPSSPVAGKSFLMIDAPSWEQDLQLSIEEIIFAGQALGRLDTGEIDIPSFGLLLAPHTAGLDFELSFQGDIEHLEYTYNTVSESLKLSGVHFHETINGDPTDPASWTTSGRFRIGNMLGGDPATLNVVTREPVPGEKRVSLDLSLPAKGTIRIENVAFGGENFGPVALDGLQVHRLQLEFLPGG